MKAISVISGVGIAFCLAIATIVAQPLLGAVLGTYLTIRIIVLCCVVAYLAAVAAFSPRRSGRIFATALVVVAQHALFFCSLSSERYIVASIAVILAGRVLLLARGFVDLVVEVALVAVAAGCAGWAVICGHSLALGIWTFFLLLSARSLIGGIRPVANAANRLWAGHSDQGGRFENAFRAAEGALARIAQRTGP